MKSDQRDMSAERRRDRHASKIADVLESFGVHAIPGDCSCGTLTVVIVHHGEPDADARGLMDSQDDDDGPHWEEKLLYEGRQIPHAVAQVATLDPARHDQATALATMRTAQNVDTWL